MAPVSCKEFLDIQATIDCRFTLKLVRDMIITELKDKIFEIFENGGIHPKTGTFKLAVSLYVCFFKGHMQLVSVVSGKYILCLNDFLVLMKNLSSTLPKQVLDILG